MEGGPLTAMTAVAGTAGRTGCGGRRRTLGSMSDTLKQSKAKIHENRAAFTHKTAQIQANRDLNNEAKRRMIREAHQAAVEEHQRLLKEHQAAKKRYEQDLFESAFAAPIPLTASVVEQAQLRNLYTGALAQAEAASGDRAALRYMLRNARIAQDRIMMTAVGRVAHRIGDFELLNEYLEARPDRANHVKALLDYQETEGSKAAKFAERVELAAPSIPVDMR